MPTKRVSLTRCIQPTWDSLVAPVITDETLGFAAHQAIASWDKGTPNSLAIGFSPSTFFSTSSTSDLLARFYNSTTHKFTLEIIKRYMYDRESHLMNDKFVQKIMWFRSG